MVMHWSYNPASEPSPGTIKVVRAAMAQISAASGIEMIEVGVTSIDVSDRDQALPNLGEGEVIIGWAPPGSPAIPHAGTLGYPVPPGGDPNAFVLGTGSPRVLPGSHDIVNGVVALNGEAKLSLDFSSGNSWGAVVLHEVGHVIGLDHSGGTQIMAPVASRTSPGHFGTGDLAGLATLKNRPCPQPAAESVPTEPTISEPPSTATTEPPTTEPPSTTEPPTTETTLPGA
jgi:hypothetical protein